MIKLKDAILKLMPTAEFTVFNEKEIIWGENCLNNHPTEEAIQAKLAELQADYDSKQYQRERATNYPSIQEQLDMQYWDAVNGTNKWQEAVAKVKTDNPKPE